MARDEHYAPRSMIAYKVTFNERGKPENIVRIDDIGGFHVGELFKGFCRDGAGVLQALSRSGKYIRIVEPVDVEGGVLVSLFSGLAGDERQVFDVESAEKRFDLSVRDASMVEVRALLSWKSTGVGYAILCVEHSVNAAGDTVLFAPFKKYLRELVPGVVVDFDPVIEAEALEEFESLEKVEVRRYIGQTDKVDGITREGDWISYVISHKRGRPFSIKSVIDVIRERVEPAVLFGYHGTPVDHADSKIYVTLKDGKGTRRTFDIYGEYGIKVMERLTPPGVMPLSDPEFISACNDRCETIAERLGRMI